MAGSFDRCVFNFLRNFSPVFYSGCTILQFPSRVGVPIPLCPQQHMLAQSLILAISVGVNGISSFYFTFPVTNDVSHFLMYLFAICIFFVEVFVQIFCQF